ncbi:MAG: transporter permease [Oerskovia sp.]|nr:transporter permease [Oerskovia sp.]
MSADRRPPAQPNRAQQHSPVSTWGAVSLVAGREISTRIRSKAFVWTTVALLVGVVLGGFLLSLVGDQGPAAQKVGVTSEAEALGPQLTAAGTAVGTEIEVTEVSEPEGRAQVADGDLDALVTGGPQSFTVVVREELGTTLSPVFTGLAQQAALSGAVTDLGGDPSAVAQEIASAAPTVETLEPAEERDPAQIVTGMVGGILIFIALMTCGQLVAQGVVEEKTSRVVELLLATIRPWQLMAGKVLGIGAIGLMQLVVVVGGGVGTAFALGLVDASSVNLGATAAWVLVWFVIGFVMYSLALAALAALVSRQEDVGSVITPVLTLMMIPYIIGISIGPWDPENPLVVWLSYIPFCSPLLMPIRIALGTVETWEILLAVGLSLALVPVLVWLAGKIYSNAVLRTGGRIKLRDALRAS